MQLAADGSRGCSARGAVVGTENTRTENTRTENTCRGMERSPHGAVWAVLCVGNNKERCRAVLSVQLPFLTGVIPFLCVVSPGFWKSWLCLLLSRTAAVDVRWL